MEESSSWRNEKCMQNSIDRLPDELLISIVSLLSLKDAARASVLARRWRYLWVFNPILDFDGSKMVHELRRGRKLLERERIRFVGGVNRVLKLHLSETIDEFTVVFDLDNSNANDIDRWIKFAFSKRVKRLELKMVRTYSGWFGQYTFPNICHPTECLRILPLGQSTCESLVSLYLTKVHVTGEVLEFFISNCPFLEELSVERADGFESLRPSCQAIRLRHLAITQCDQFRTLEICSPNLVSYTFSGLYITMVLKDVSSLINLSLAPMMPWELSNILLDHSGCFARLETLTLQTTTTLDHEELEFPNLPRLRKLVFDIHARGHESLLCFTSLINAAPLLQEIVLKLTRTTGWILRPAQCPDKGQKHQCLKVCEISGFASAAAAVEVALYVLENATSLEKMVINGKAATGKGLDLLKSTLASETWFLC